MLVLLLIFFLHTSIQAENDETKLIDLLPEKEKEQFLNQIARRILEEVQSNGNSSKASGELSDAQLNQHDAYVQKILKEESQNLRKKSDDAAITDSATNVTSNKKENVRSDDGYVDLTLRSDHRSKRDNNSKLYTEHSNKNASDNESESEVDIQVKNFRRSRETAEKPDYEDTVTINQNAKISDENKKYTEMLVDNIDITTQNSIVEKNSTLLLEPYDNDEKNNNTAIKNNELSNNSTNNLQEMTLKSSQNNSKVSKNDSSTHYEDNLTVSTAPQIESKNVLKSDKKQYPKVNNKVSDLQTTKIEKSVAETVILTTLPPILEKLQTLKVKDGKTKPDVDAEIFIAPEYVNSFDKVNKIKDSTQKNNMDFKLLPTNDPIQKALRQKPQEKIYEKQDVYSKDLKARYEMNNLKAYEVYEISPGANPFVKRDTIKVEPQITNKPFINEQPHYAPIYNYKPQNAFFDGRNIYGLNTYSEKEEDIYKAEENSHENNNMKNMYTMDYYNDIYDKNKGKNTNRDIYTLIYNHSPSNAFYNADNIYGRNDDSERIDYSESNGANIDNFFIENDNKDDLILNDHDYDEKRNNIQWDYYFYNDPYRALGLNKKAERNLDWTQVRMGIKNNKKYCGNRPCDEYKDFTTESPKCVESDELLYSTNRNHSNPPYLGDSVRHIRQLLLEQKAFSFIKPAEDHHALSDELEELEAKDLSFLRDTHFIPKDPYRTNRDGNNSKKKNLNQKRVNKIGNETEYSFTKKILDMVPSGKDLVVILKQVSDLLPKDKMKVQRSNNFEDIDVIATVLEDMIYQNNKALVQYAWLETAVDFQSALKKMFDLVGFQEKEDIHPSDLELLKYLVYLHSSAKEDILYNGLSEVRSMLPKSRKKKIITESGLLQRMWLKRMLSSESEIPRGDLASFEEFLGNLQTAVFDLHIALKYIAMVTKYNNQRWFQNLKELYIDPNRKQILQIMLHLWATRILGLVQESAKNGLEDDYWTYINKNEEEVNRTKQELVFVLRLLDEIKRR